MQGSPENAVTQQQSTTQLPPREIIIKQGDLETIDEEAEEFVIADFSQVPEAHSVLDEAARAKQRKAKKNFLGNLAAAVKPLQ